MSENPKHIEIKNTLMTLAKQLGYHCKCEVESPQYMSFFTGEKKKFVDVWCEYYENRNNILFGRQIAIEVYYSEKITKIDLDPVYNDLKFNPSESFRLVVCSSVDEPYTITNEQSGKYFDLHIIPYSQIELVKTFLELGKEYLREDYKPKIIDEIYTNIAGIYYGEIKQVCNTNLWYEIKEGTELKLEREPDNEDDVNAIKILYKNCKVGYVPREHAKKLSFFMDNGTKYNCIVTGKSGSIFNNPQISIRIY